MNIVNPMRTPGDASTNNCACICDNGSAYWDVVGENYSSRCGCQCIEGNSTNTAANRNLATSKAP